MYHKASELLKVSSSSVSPSSSSFHLTLSPSPFIQISKKTKLGIVEKHNFYKQLCVNTQRG
ncbi:hypothetical protein Hanom_Chr07g00649431 [Helianthus anomalus]